MNLHEDIKSILSGKKVERKIPKNDFYVKCQLDETKLGESRVEEIYWDSKQGCLKVYVEGDKSKTAIDGIIKNIQKVL